MRHQPEFALFSLLPVELRLQVWRQSCNPRLVEIRLDRDKNLCFTSTPTPAVLQVCRESRREALCVYSLHFGTKDGELGIRFCPWLDTLYLPRSDMTGYDDSFRAFSDHVQNTDGIMRLAIDYVDPSIRQPWETYNKHILIQSFPRVPEIFLVVPHKKNSDEGRENDYQLVDVVGDDKALSKMLSREEESFIYEVMNNFTDDGRDFERVKNFRLPKFILKSKKGANDNYSWSSHHKT